MNHRHHKARFPIDWVFALGVVMVLGALGWSYLFLTTQATVDTLIDTALDVTDEPGAGAKILSAVDRFEADSVLPCGADGHQWASAFLLDAAQFKQVGNVERLNLLAKAQEELTRAIACRYADGNLWLLVAQRELLSRNTDAANTALLTSYRKAPNDAFVIVRRLLLLAVTQQPLGADLQNMVAHDLIMLRWVRSDYKKGLYILLGVENTKGVIDWFIANRGLSADLMAKVRAES